MYIFVWLAATEWDRNHPRIGFSTLVSDSHNCCTNSGSTLLWSIGLLLNPKRHLAIQHNPAVILEVADKNSHGFRNCKTFDLVNYGFKLKIVAGGGEDTGAPTESCHVTVFFGFVRCRKVGTKIWIIKLPGGTLWRASLRDLPYAATTSLSTKNDRFWNANWSTWKTWVMSRTLKNHLKNLTYHHARASSSNMAIVDNIRIHYICFIWH